jgi:hypothetical protein
MASSSAMQNIKRRIERHSQNANSGVKMYCLFIMPLCMYKYMLSLFSEVAKWRTESHRMTLARTKAGFKFLC